MKNYDAILIGAGIIGCAVARSLAESGWNVAIVDKGRPGSEASWAAAGMLSPSAEAEEGSILFALGRASLKLYASFSDELASETGIDPCYRKEGTLLVFQNERERAPILRSMDWQRSQGIVIEELSDSQLKKKESSLANCAGAFFLAEDHQIDNRLLMQSLIASCARRGVDFILGQEVREVRCVDGRATGVALDGEFIPAGNVINTAGAWGGAFKVAGASAAIRPVKGHMVSLGNRAAPINHVIRRHNLYLVPRKNGTVIVGSTMEEVGFDKTIRADAIERLIREARRICPALDRSSVIESWTGLRPASPDGLPILGPTPIDGYWMALGHFRNGILLAPITAQIMSSWILRGNSSTDVASLGIDRFPKSC